MNNMSKAMLCVEGGYALKGEMQVSGAKNSALFLVAAALMTDEQVTLGNMPAITDIDILHEILLDLGIHSLWTPSENRMVIEARQLSNSVVNSKLSRKLRGSIALACPVLYRLNRCIIPYPGGDMIGKRPLDEMMRGIEMMGGDVEFAEGLFSIRIDRPLKAIEMELEYPSHTATMALMMLGAVSEGRTVITNAALEPEVIDMQELLLSMGAVMSGAGTDKIVIDGVPKLRGGSIEVMPDRLQVGTYIMGALMTDGHLKMPTSYVEHLDKVLDLLMEAGATCIKESDGQISIGGHRPYKAIRFETEPYPGFPTDLQSPMMAFLSVCKGTSYAKENIFENRLLHIKEFKKMGIKVEILSEREVLISGPNEYISGTTVNAEEIRGGAALLLCALSMPLGYKTYISNIGHIMRGYPSIVDTLCKLGAKISFEDSETSETPTQTLKV
ncbi:hypothetical protein CIG75_02610 [Tumebacillus algifaecis]|uniref:UDP-N-acetylglucosamine 1-carboxyvinyltransferase n=1 Tax=Tumebacillus algifaecis TaxID=1214604 RepID=A0A223CXF0_9BACL|nr:UDP-N-acetylglucosamine 1-carboxyvinyltransferase [Tumebacillus algifaecis]ASS73981.1 hypothetical protein CIG75_02610 [Tumebacillus algifaecis]